MFLSDSHTQKRFASGKWHGIDILMLLVILGIEYLIVRNNNGFGDETAHLEEIRNLLNGRFVTHPSLPQFPGFHALFAAVAYLTHIDTFPFYRFLSGIVSVISIIVFHAAAKILHGNGARMRTFQYAFIPILFPYFFLVYTDVLSLLLVLTMLLFLLRRQYVIAAIAGIASLFVRQNNIIWMAFGFLYFLLEEGPSILQTLTRRFRSIHFLALFPYVRQRMTVQHALLVATVFGAGFFLFFAFVFWNGGVAIGDAGAHPIFSFHVGNIFFCLWLTFFIFLPLHMENVRSIGALLIRSSVAWMMLALVFSFFMMQFANDHAYNQGIDSIFFRNRILTYFTLTQTLKALFFLPMGYAILSLRCTRLVRRSFFLLYPMTVLYLGPSWLIEQRYYFIPLAFFLLFREERTESFENVSAAYSLAAALVVFIPVALLWFFL